MATDAMLVPGSAADHAICALLKLGQVASRLTDDRLLGLGVRVRHYNALQALQDNGRMSQADVGAHLRVDPATIVATLDDLENLGLAARHRHPSDRRRYLIDLTEKGEITLPRIRALLDSVQAEMFEALSPDQSVALADALAAMNAAQPLADRYDTVRGR
ncbi:winged helix-turn-helix transcriptional regulator [Antrihabitans sp. YC3-6]|uniref:Winged helix-turn-helix transcriptional regulator n=1 Tax=Antrihabitans stalagmiti TaxID=2799499 RepID=A0A934NME1_9NOCA|nr:MarR family winged helix-turn-helix transcriptional regulator [Antrihabitans stalagmiti]MBJ8337879.1 winged helix-turn-helix transcriptional regulator [Antrihabitans stalagmiti]